MPLDAFSELKMCQNACADGDPPRTSLRELTVLARLPSWIWVRERSGKGKGWERRGIPGTALQYMLTEYNKRSGGGSASTADD